LSINKRTHHLYALKHYTESGELKPPPLLLYILLFLSRTWGLLIISVSSTKTGENVLSLFYPDKTHFYAGLCVGLLPLIILFISGRRHAQDRWAIKYWPSCFIILTIAILGDAVLQFYYLYLDHFLYSFTASIQLVMIIWIAIYCAKSQQLKDAFK